MALSSGLRGWWLSSLTAVAIAALAPGCMGAGEPESDDPYENYSVEALTSACTASAIRAGTSPSRRPIIDRALNWVSNGVIYSQSPQPRWGGYRTDCSGLVSMAWGLPPPGNTTHSFAGGPWDNGRSQRIQWSELEPGDALNNPQHHIMLFAGWLDENHTRFCTIEEYNWGRPASIIHHTIHDTSHGQPFRSVYIPCRSSNAPPSSSVAPSSGGSSGGAACYSQTLGREMPALSCVESRFDRTWYQCVGGLWRPGRGTYGACASSNNLGPTGNATCRSDTLGRTVTEGTCVESRFDDRWYQCTDSGWVYDPSISGNRRGPIGACTTYNPLR
jgi:hypothetical protein